VIDHERLLYLIDYNKINGLFYWKVRLSPRANLDKPIGTINGKGYLQCKIDGKYYLLHRLAWFYVYKVWPVDRIDHKDTILTNNWIDNLRDSTASQNACNRGKTRFNKSGYKGVYWSKPVSKWYAQIKLNGKKQTIGYFDCPIEAHRAYCNSAKILHKEFANSGI
jgi:hypothetical protein